MVKARVSDGLMQTELTPQSGVLRREILAFCLQSRENLFGRKKKEEEKEEGRRKKGDRKERKRERRRGRIREKKKKRK
tara:strand:+ start:397 stop:630 length:234 start_codon:yes stop_codon:yes gene_type:complete